MSTTTALSRSLNDRMIAGVVGGIARRFGCISRHPGLPDPVAADPESGRLSRVPRWLGALQVLGALWTLPNTLIGLAIGTLGACFGAQPRWSATERAVVFHAWPWGPGGAMTLGNVILLKGASLELQCATYAHAAGRCVHPAVRLGDHERAHVYQYMLLGPLFLPVICCAAVSTCATRWSAPQMPTQCTATVGGRGGLSLVARSRTSPTTGERGLPVAHVAGRRRSRCR